MFSDLSSFLLCALSSTYISVNLYLCNASKKCFLSVSCPNNSTRYSTTLSTILRSDVGNSFVHTISWQYWYIDNTGILGTWYTYWYTWYTILVNFKCTISLYFTWTVPAGLSRDSTHAYQWMIQAHDCEEMLSHWNSNKFCFQFLLRIGNVI